MSVMNGIEDRAMRLLQATREQLHGKPTRQVEPCEVAEKAGINPYSREYETTMRYLLDHGYIEPYPNLDFGSLGFYRVTNKGLEEILSSP
jgi:hypothetical protein